MPTSPGSRLGPYEIVSRIGAGGMGEVFRARDTRLDRSVAIKVLPAAFAANAQLKLRFERERLMKNAVDVAPAIDGHVSDSQSDATARLSPAASHD